MIVLIQVFRVVISEQIIVNLEPVKCKRRTTLGKSLLFSRVLYRELWPATYCSRVSRYPHRLPVQHILWSGRRRANCYWTHCMHAWWRKMPRYPKIQTGRMVQLCTESVGRTLLLQCWRSGGGRHNAAEKALCAICLGNKNFMFFDGERSALLYGLIGTCLLNDIDPEEYLRHILSVLPE